MSIRNWVILFLCTGGSASAEKSRYHLFNPTPRDQLREMATDRPDVTESPITVDAGHMQVELSFLQYTRDARSDGYDLLPTNFKIGLTNSADLQLVLQPYFIGRAPGADVDGPGDSQVRLKWNLFGNDRGPIALALMPFVSLPTGSRGVGAEHLEGGLIIPARLDLLNEFDLGLMVEFDIVRDSQNEGYRLDVLHTVALGRPVVGPIGAFAEYVGVMPMENGQPYLAFVGGGGDVLRLTRHPVGPCHPDGPGRTCGGLWGSGWGLVSPLRKVRCMRSLVVVMLVAGALLGCDPVAAEPDSAGRPIVVATTTMIGDLVRQIAGDRVELVTIMAAGVDPHSYKPSTADMGNVARARLVLYNGLHLEGKMVELLEERMRDRAVAVTRDIDRSRLLPWAAGESGAYDPHVWFDPTLWRAAAETVAGELARVDPANAAEYASRGAAVAANLQRLHEEMKARLASIPRERRVLITSHDAFNYFGRAYDVDVRGLQGISTETQAGLASITAAVDYIVARKIPAVFVESSVPHATIERVQADCRSRGVEVKIGGELYSDAMGTPGERPGYAVETYEGMMRYNVDLIVRALK